MNVFYKFKRNIKEYLLRRKFKVYGHNAIVLKPCMFTNTPYIEIEENVVIREFARIEAITHDGYSEYNPVLRIGKNTFIEQFFHVGACECVQIGENVLIAGRVYISDHNHKFCDINKPILRQGIQPGGKVVIGDNAWIGEGSVILPGVTVGRNSVIGANAVVTHDIPPFSVAVGIPAKVVKQYDPKSDCWKRVNHEQGT